MLNSTFGIAGLVDVATKMGLERNDQDFGLTLEHWGINSGPYIILPLLGPSTVRDAVGTLVDDYAGPYPYIQNIRIRNSLHGLDIVDARANFLPKEKLMQSDRYIFIRNAYLDQRGFQSSDKELQEDF